MKKYYQNFQLAKLPGIKYIPPLGSVLHATRALHGTPQQLNNVNIDCVIDCFPKYLTHLDKNEIMSLYSLFSV